MIGMMLARMLRILLKLHCFFLEKRSSASESLIIIWQEHNLTSSVSRFWWCISANDNSANSMSALSKITQILIQCTQRSTTKDCNWIIFLWLIYSFVSQYSHRMFSSAYDCSTTSLWSLHASDTMFCRSRVFSFSRFAIFATKINSIFYFSRGMYGQSVFDFEKLHHDFVSSTRSSQCLSYASTWIFRKYWCSKTIDVVRCETAWNRKSLIAWCSI